MIFNVVVVAILVAISFAVFIIQLPIFRRLGVKLPIESHVRRLSGQTIFLPLYVVTAIFGGILFGASGGIIRILVCILLNAFGVAAIWSLQFLLCLLPLSDAIAAQQRSLIKEKAEVRLQLLRYLRKYGWLLKEGLRENNTSLESVIAELDHSND